MLNLCERPKFQCTYGLQYDLWQQNKAGPGTTGTPWHKFIYTPKIILTCVKR